MRFSHAELANLYPDTALNLFDAVLIIGIAIPSLYMASKVNQPKLRILASLLAGFLLIHGLYHAGYVLADLTGQAIFETASDLLFGPLGYLLFLVFAVSFARSTA
jgi:hypothetical protein